jgi:hypothetical protein
MDERIRKRMREVEQAVLDLDESVRGAAFLVMQGYILEGSTTRELGTEGIREDRSSAKRTRAGKGDEKATPPPADFTGFVDTFESDNESDNAKMIAAHLYSEYGAEPFSLDEVRRLAKAGGVTVPERLDMTLLQATSDKKRLFKRAGKGVFRPSVHGQAYLKKKYGVKMGTKTRPSSGEPA